MEDRLTSEASAQPEPGDGRVVLLSIENLRVWFELRRFGFGRAGYVKAVDGVSFTLHAGEAIAVVGESGCGKSSLMKTILGLYKPTQGRVVFDGDDLAQLDREGMQQYHAHVGYVQQDPYGALPPFMNVQRILEEPLLVGGVRSKEERLQRVRKSMEEVKLTPVDDFLQKFPHMLSGGPRHSLCVRPNASKRYSRGYF